MKDQRQIDGSYDQGRQQHQRREESKQGYHGQNYQEYEQVYQNDYRNQDNSSQMELVNLRDNSQYQTMDQPGQTIDHQNYAMRPSQTMKQDTLNMRAEDSILPQINTNQRMSMQQINDMPAGQIRKSKTNASGLVEAATPGVDMMSAKNQKAIKQAQAIFKDRANQLRSLYKEHDVDESLSDDSIDVNKDDIKKLKKQLRKGKMKIRMSRNRKHGIQPADFHLNSNHIINTCFKPGEDGGNGSDDEDQEEGDDDLPFLEWIVIDNENQIYLIWQMFVTICCVVSSYLYAFIAAFENPNPGETLFNITLFFESVFLVSLCVNFLVSYQPEGEEFKVKDLTLISQRYLKGQFLFDFIPLVPLQAISLADQKERLFFVIKIIRLVNGFKLFHVAKIMKVIQNHFQKKLQVIIKEKPELADNMDIDNNNISLLIMISNALKIFRLVIIILSISYFLGFAWFIICQEFFERQQNYQAELKESYEVPAEWEAFLNTKNLVTFYGTHEDSYVYKYAVDSDLPSFNNDLNYQKDLENSLKVVYFAFTSLSTVGFGDFHPKSDIERLLCAFILLFGVAIFSYIMGIFITILEEFQQLNAELDEGDELTKFFGLIQYFNDNIPVNLALKEEIEQHFDYRWTNDRNQAIDEASEKEMLEQLPDHVQNKLYQQFLFRKFLSVFRDTFKINKTNSEKGPNGVIPFYTWADQNYRDFMMQILQKLEPRKMFKNQMIFEELDDINEIIFVQLGQVDIGYEVNKRKKFVIRYTNKTLIGAFNCTFNVRAIFCYLAKTDCEGFMIRKVDWMEILRSTPEIGDVVKENVKQDYFNNIKDKVLAQKDKDLLRITKRFDYQQIQTILSKDIVQQMVNDKTKVVDKPKTDDIMEQINECDDDQEKFCMCLDYVDSSVNNLRAYINELEDENESLAEEVQFVFEEIERYKHRFEQEEKAQK